MTNLEKVQFAIDAFDACKNPHMPEELAFISSLLKEAGLGSLENSTIDDMYLSKFSLHISTTWYARGCANESTYTLPLCIIEADDPILEAKRWNYSTKITETARLIDSLRKDLDRAKDYMGILVDQYEELMGPT